MALQQIQFNVVLTDINCGECGGTYAINERFRKQCADKGTSWNCPYCKIGWGYAGNGRIEKLEKALEEERARKQAALERANQARHEVQHLSTQLKGTKTRLRNHRERSKNGVCPCCNRTFKQLAAHMASKHPDFTP